MWPVIYRPVIYCISAEPRWWFGRVPSTLDSIISSFPIKLWQVSFAKHRVWLAEVSWAAWTPEPPLTHDCKGMDSAVIVHCLSTSVTSHSYADAILIPYLENQQQSVTTLDVALDIDTPDSLNESAPAERQVCVQESVWLHQIVRQLDGLPSWLNEQEGTFLFPRLDSSPGYQPTLCVSQQGKLWFPLVKASPYKTVIKRRRTRGLWSTYCMPWSRGSRLSICTLSTQMPQLSLLAYSMIWLRINIWATSEWPLAWTRMIGFTVLPLLRHTNIVKVWGATITRTLARFKGQLSLSTKVWMEGKQLCAVY